MPISGGGGAVRASEIEGSADLAGGAFLAIQPASGSVGFITYGHEDGATKIDLYYIDGVTTESLALDDLDNFSVPGAIPICNTRYCRANNRVAGAKFMSYVGVLFS